MGTWCLPISNNVYLILLYLNFALGDAYIIKYVMTLHFSKLIFDFWFYVSIVETILFLEIKSAVINVARELMHRISWNFIISITSTLISIYQLLVEIVQQMALQSNVFQIFWDAQISASIQWNETKIYRQNI